MKDELISTVFVHKKNKTQYVLVRRCKLRHPDTGQWLSGVVYYGCTNPKAGDGLGEEDGIELDTSTEYVRTESDWDEAFTPIQEYLKELVNKDE